MNKSYGRAQPENHRNSSQGQLDDFFIKLKEDKRSLKQKRYRRWKRQKEIIQKELEIDEKRQNERRELKEKELKMRREQILERLEKKKKQSLNASIEVDTRSIRQSKSKPLFKKLEKEYKKHVLLPELNKSKEILNERK